MQAFKTLGLKLNFLLRLESRQCHMCHSEDSWGVISGNRTRGVIVLKEDKESNGKIIWPERKRRLWSQWGVWISEGRYTLSVTETGWELGELHFWKNPSFSRMGGSGAREADDCIGGLGMMGPSHLKWNKYRSEHNPWGAEVSPSPPWANATRRMLFFHKTKYVFFQSVILINRCVSAIYLGRVFPFEILFLVVLLFSSSTFANICYYNIWLLENGHLSLRRESFCLHMLMGYGCY